MISCAELGSHIQEAHAFTQQIYSALKPDPDMFIKPLCPTFDQLEMVKKTVSKGTVPLIAAFKYRSSTNVPESYLVTEETPYLSSPSRVITRWQTGNLSSDGITMIQPGTEPIEILGLTEEVNSLEVADRLFGNPVFPKETISVQLTEDGFSFIRDGMRETSGKQILYRNGYRYHRLGSVRLMNGEERILYGNNSAKDAFYISRDIK